MTDFVYSKDPLIRHMQKETRENNQSFYLIFTGAGGAGKSYACLEMLRLVDPEFDVSRVAFSNKEFIQLLKRKLPPGSAVMWDEAGVGLDSREFMSLINKVLSYVTMTMRYRRQIIAMTVPDMQWVDIKTRKLLHAYIEMLKIFKGSRSVGKYHMLQTNYRFGKTYHKCPVVFKGGSPYIVSTVEFNMPPKSMTEPYEKYKSKFGDEILAMAEDAVNMLEYKKLQRKVSDREILDYVKANRDEFRRDRKIDVDKIALKYDLTKDRCNAIRKKLGALNLIYKRGKNKKKVYIKLRGLRSSKN